MRASPAVVDTNVVVAALLTANPDSPTARILDGMLAGSFPFLLSVPLLAEYRSVLLRPPIRRLHGLEPEEIDRILTELTLAAMVVDDVEPAGEGSGGGDRHLWALVGARPGAVLVTGDRELLEHPRPGAEVLSARAFADRLAEGER